MIIIHASAWGGRFVLWGETSAAATPAKPTRKPKSSRRVEPARFALEVDRLAEATAAEISGLAFSNPSPRHWFAWLPSNERGALPSSPLLTDEPEDQGAVVIAPWETPVLALTTEQAVAVLLAAVDKTTWGPGVVVGKTLNYWATVLGFAGALVARQRYLPGLIADAVGPTFQAIWEPVLTGADRHQAEQLARSMPHACRALGPDDAEPPRTSPSDLLTETLGVVVDYLVRSASGPSGKAPKRFPSLHDQWLHALKASDGRMTGDPRELTKLAEQAWRWRRPLEAASTAPFRLCLRLEEPEGESDDLADDWRMAYMLQAVDDPSLLVPAAAVWKGRGREAAVLERDGFRPREYLLSALGQAAAPLPADRGEPEDGRARRLHARRLRARTSS